LRRLVALLSSIVGVATMAGAAEKKNETQCFSGLFLNH
jgi:hypothetical protein